MANSSVRYTGAGGGSWWIVNIDTINTYITIDQDNLAGDPLGRNQLLISALCYNNIAHDLTFNSYHPVTLVSTDLPTLEFDGSIGMLERFGPVFLPSKPGEILRVKSSAAPVQYLFAISTDQDFLKTR